MKKKAAPKPKFHEGEEAARRFDELMDAVLSVPKDKIMELEKEHSEKQKAAKKK